VFARCYPPVKGNRPAAPERRASCPYRKSNPLAVDRESGDAAA